MSTRARLATGITLALALCLTLGAGTAAGSGGKNAYSNPGGDPPDDTYQEPFANSDGGRMLIYCADDETLVLTPADGGGVEATCVPAG